MNRPRRQPLVLLSLVSLLASSALAGCGSSAPAPPPPAVDAAPPPVDSASTTVADAAPDLTVPADLSPDQSPTTPDARLDAGPQPYVRNDGGPFGLAARAAVQTCKPPADPTRPPMLLSATGCVDAKDPTRPAESLIPYDVNSPLWSDGADKQRFMAIPDGALIHVKDCAHEPQLCKPTVEGGTTPDDGHFELPVGTVLVKSFLFNGKLLETRLFMRYADMWRGLSYQWNDAQTDATVVGEFGLNKTITNAGKQQSWYFPSRTDCNECHNDTVGGSLGLETMQLDRMYKYPSGQTADQLATLEHLGVLDAPVTRVLPLLDPRLPDPGGTRLEARVRSYLHGNCAICHRPEGDYAAIDLRYGVSLADMNMCNVDPNKGDLGVAGVKRLAPNDLTRSVILLRMKAPDKVSGRMPQLASSVLDPTGIDLVTRWIQSISKCP
jgi:uncharacterized repeat protein (TIGR03806 family)